MIEAQCAYKMVNASQLTGELDAQLGAKVIGVSTYGPDRPISVWLDDSASPDDQKTASNVVAAHTPTSSKAPPPTVTDLQAQLDSVQQQLNSLKASQQPA